MFIRIFRPKEDKELLLNVNHIAKIEVRYAVSSNDGSSRCISLEQGMANPDAVRVYRVYAAGEELLLESDPDDPVVKVLEQIYKDAIKA